MVSLEEMEKKSKLKILLKGPTATGKCIKGNSLILTEKGLIKIEDLVCGKTDMSNKNCKIDQYQRYFDFEENESCEGYIDNIKNINSVISMSPEMKYRTYEISAKYNMGESDTIGIKTSLGFEVIGTPEHKVIVINKDGDLVFRKLENINKGDNIAISYNTNVFNDKLKLYFSRQPKGVYAHHKYNLKNIEYVNEDIARLIGYVIAEGTCCFRDKEQNEPFSIQISNYDLEIIGDIINICKEMGVIAYEQKENEKTVGVKINSIMLVDFMYYLGYRHGAKNKEVPWSILQADKKSQIEFLRVLFDTDGSISKEEVEYYSSSYELCRQMQLMLLNLGIIARFNEKKGVIADYKGEIREYEKSYRLSLYGEEILKFYEIVNFGLTRKKEILNLLVDKLRNRERYSKIIYPNLSKKLNILYEKLKLLGKNSLYIRDGDVIRYMSAKSYLQYYNFKHLSVYISGIRQPSKMVFKRILDVLSPVKNMETETYEYLQSIMDNFLFDSVEQIKRGKDIVYDVTINDVHSYIGNGVVNHNTFTCTKIAEIAIKGGKKVLYLDHDRGATEEIKKYLKELVKEGKSDKVDNFIYEDYFSFMDLIKKIKKYVYEDKIDLLIIDPLPLIQIARLTATDEIKKQGFYYFGEKLIKLVDMVNPEEYAAGIEKQGIDNKTTYTLRGWQYQLPNEWEYGAKDMLVSIPPDVVVTLLLPDEKNSLDPQFDYVFEMVKIDTPKQIQKTVNNQIVIENVIERQYKGIPRKVRGERSTEIIEIADPWKVIIKPFCRKYLSKEC